MLKSKSYGKTLSAKRCRFESCRSDSVYQVSAAVTYNYLRVAKASETVLHFRHGNNTSPDINRADLGVRDVRVSSFLWGFAKWLRHSTLTATSCVRFADPQFTVCDYMDLRRLHFCFFSCVFFAIRFFIIAMADGNPHKSLPICRCGGIGQTQRT